MLRGFASLHFRVSSPSLVSLLPDQAIKLAERALAHAHGFAYDRSDLDRLLHDKNTETIIKRAEAISGVHRVPRFLEQLRRRKQVLKNELHQMKMTSPEILREIQEVTAAMPAEHEAQQSPLPKLPNFRFAERRRHHAAQQQTSSSEASESSTPPTTRPVSIHHIVHKHMRKALKHLKDVTWANLPHSGPVEHTRSDGQRLEDCFACRMIWHQVEMDVQNARFIEDVQASFEHNCAQAQLSNIFYRACEIMHDDMYAFVDDYMSSKYTVDQMCLRGKICKAAGSESSESSS